MQDQETITKIHNKHDEAIRIACSLPQSAETSQIVWDIVDCISQASILLTTLRHDVFRKTGEWVEPVECMGGN
jgi:hypothetical protein